MFNLRTDQLVLGHVSLPELPYLEAVPPLMCSDDAFSWLLDQKDLIGWTFSLSKNIWSVMRFARCITNKSEHISDPRLRHACNTHLKCYIAKKEMLVGSFNLTAPTILDLCVLIKDKKAIAHMTKEFNKHWKLLA